MIDFMGMRRIAYTVAIALMVVSVIAIAARGLNFGIDFTGGTLVEVGYPQAVDLAEVRTALRDAGYVEAVAQSFGTPRDVLIRLGPSQAEDASTLSERVLDALRAGPHGAGIELRRIEFVGPQVGKELAEYGGLAVLISLIGILIYIALRFEKRFAVGAVLGLVHDVVIVIGIWSLFQLDFDLPVLAAVLAVIGYSLNDTIVVYDRIRENFRKMRKGEVAEIINISVNQTLSRTIITSGTTLFSLFALYIFGGEILRNFSLMLILGVIIGVFSTVFIASALVLALGVSKKDMMPVVKEKADESGAQI